MCERERERKKETQSETEFETREKTQERIELKEKRYEPSVILEDRQKKQQLHRQGQPKLTRIKKEGEENAANARSQFEVHSLGHELF